MIQLSTANPPDRKRLDSGSKPDQPRHHVRRRSGGIDAPSWAHNHRRAAMRCPSSRRRVYSTARSPSTSSRSANGTSARTIAVSSRVTFYIVEQQVMPEAEGFTSRPLSVDCPGLRNEEVLEQADRIAVGHPGEEVT